MSDKRKIRNRSSGPRKEYNPVVVVIRIFDLNDKFEAEHIKTIDGAERRQWISDTVMWAMLNHKFVEIVNKVDDKED